VSLKSARTTAPAVSCSPRRRPRPRQGRLRGSLLLHRLLLRGSLLLGARLFLLRGNLLLKNATKLARFLRGGLPCRLSAVAAPPSLLRFRWQPKTCFLQAAALTLRVSDVYRPRVRLRAARAPPRFPLCRHPEVWYCQPAVLALLIHNVHRPRVCLRAASAPARLPLCRQPVASLLHTTVPAHIFSEADRPRVRLRAASAPPPTLRGRRQPEGWHLQFAALALLVDDAT
jgi:hypothetical protein